MFIIIRHIACYGLLIYDSTMGLFSREREKNDLIVARMLQLHFSAKSYEKWGEKVAKSFENKRSHVPRREPIFS